MAFSVTMMAFPAYLKVHWKKGPKVRESAGREVIRHALSQPPEKADVARLAAQLIDYHTHGVFAQKPAPSE